MLIRKFTHTSLDGFRDGAATDVDDLKAPSEDDLRKELDPNYNPDDTDLDDPGTGDDTGTDTSGSDDTGTDTSDEPNDDLLTKYNLERYGSVEKAFEALQNNNAEITQSRQRESQLRTIINDLSVSRQPAPLTSEQVLANFDDDPIGTLTNAGMATKKDLAVTQEALKQVQNSQEIMNLSTSLSSMPELNDVATHMRNNSHNLDVALAFPQGKNATWDKMVQFYRTPGFVNSKFLDVAPVLYQAASGKSQSANTNNNVQVSMDKKNRAKTATTGKGGNVKSGAPDYSDPVKWPADKIKADMIRRGLYIRT